LSVVVTTYVLFNNAELIDVFQSPPALLKGKIATSEE
jgi:hypothetical protein